MNTCAKLSIMKVVTEVKVLPNYAAGDEVCAHYNPATNDKFNFIVSLNSGLLLMLDVTRHPMPSIPLFSACLEGNYVFNCCE